MCNSCNTLSMILNNLFGNGCGCNNSAPASNNNCGCGNNWNTFSNGFVSGVNAVNAANGNNGCGCNNSTPASNNNCGCGNGFDNYYAQQYALGPYAQNNGCGCGNNF